MNNKDYIDERIVNAFSAYVSKIIHNSSIDFIRKYRRSQANEILFGYNFNNIVSLYQISLSLSPISIVGLPISINKKGSLT